VLQALRAEARATLHALLLLLLIPVLHPVAEARAIESGTASVICSTFGDAQADPLALADDLPDCLACAIAAAALPPEPGFAPALAPVIRALAPVAEAASIRVSLSAPPPPARGPPAFA
jgi:hypothetical protein